MAQTGSRRIELSTIVLVLIWLSVLIFGFKILIEYENTPGQFAQHPETWPLSSIVEFDSQKTNLVMFAHPQCPCSEASVEELNRLLARFKHKLKAHVVFMQTGGYDEDWVKSKLWQQANSITGVSTYIDKGSREVRAFNVHTSGEVLLYSVAGKLVFNGGVTGSRGHMGDNLGVDLISRYLKTGNIGQDHTQVFGCVLDSANRHQEKL